MSTHTYPWINTLNDAILLILDTKPYSYVVEYHCITLSNTSINPLKSIVYLTPTEETNKLLFTIMLFCIQTLVITQLVFSVYSLTYSQDLFRISSKFHFWHIFLSECGIWWWASYQLWSCFSWRLVVCVYMYWYSLSPRTLRSNCAAKHFVSTLLMLSWSVAMVASKVSVLFRRCAFSNVIQYLRSFVNQYHHL